MKITSNLLGLIARATDVTDRAITSNIDVKQEALYPFPAIPDTNLNDSSLGSLPQRSSFHARAEMQLTNAASITSFPCILGRGLWLLKITAHYTANFAVVGPGAGGSVIIGAVNSEQPVMQFVPTTTTNVIVTQEFRVLTTDDLTRVIGFLFTNGVGQTHNLIIGIWGEKYL